MTRDVVGIFLETFSKTGGLQNFNKRVIDLITGQRSQEGNAQKNVYLVGDRTIDIPSRLNMTCVAVGRSNPVDMLGVILRTFTSRKLLIGHINLLPLGVFCKILNPRLRLGLFVHGDDVWNQSGHRPRRWYEPIFLRMVTKISSVSSYTAEVMAREYGVKKDKFIITPNAVDLVPPIDNCAARKNIILSVTRMERGDEDKNIDKLIDAFSLLRSRHKDLLLVIVGDGALRGPLECKARDLGLSEDIQFLGRISDDELDNVYRAARVFVLPSTKEGFGIVYLEAWLRGLPVICSDRGAPKEIVSDGIDGFVIDADDIKLMASKMELLIDNPAESDRLGAAGRAKVEQLYSQETFAINLSRYIFSL